MNRYNWMLKQGIEGMMKAIKDGGFENLGQLIESYTGVECKSYGIMNGGLMLNVDTIELLKALEMPEDA